MSKSAGIVLAMAVLLGVPTVAQERIAVLDTEIPKGMDTKVIIPVTEKLMEEFVRSKKFTVLDRSFIAKTLSELEFSASDLASSDEKLAKVGGFLKAKYIVVSTVQRLETRYFLSAKMIEVATGVIVAQASVDRTGTVTVLIDMAGELGLKLVAAATGKEAPAAAPARAAPTRTAPAASTGGTKAAAAPASPRAQGERFGTFSVDVGSSSNQALYDSSSTDQMDLYSRYYTSYLDPEIPTGLSYGLSGIFPAGLFYTSVGVTVSDFTFEDGYLVAEGISYTTYASVVDIFVGVGLNAPIGPLLAYIGPRLCLAVYDWEEERDDGSSYYATWSGFGFGAETGLDIRLGSWALGARLSYSAVLDMEETNGDALTLDVYQTDITLRLGYAF